MQRSCSSVRIMPEHHCHEGIAAPLDVHATAHNSFARCPDSRLIPEARVVRNVDLGWLPSPQAIPGRHIPSSSMPDLLTGESDRELRDNATGLDACGAGEAGGGLGVGGATLPRSMLAARPGADEESIDVGGEDIEGGAGRGGIMGARGAPVRGGGAMRDVPCSACPPLPPLGDDSHSGAEALTPMPGAAEPRTLRMVGGDIVKPEPVSGTLVRSVPGRPPPRRMRVPPADEATTASRDVCGADLEPDCIGMDGGCGARNPNAASNESVTRGCISPLPPLGCARVGCMPDQPEPVGPKPAPMPPPVPPPPSLPVAVRGEGAPPPSATDPRIIVPDMPAPESAIPLLMPHLAPKTRPC